VDYVYLQERITKTKALIELYEDAITAIATNGAQSYLLDTGQSRQSVTKLDLPNLQKGLDSLYNRLCMLQARLDGNNSGIAIPGW